MNVGSAVPSLTTNVLNQIPIIIPENNIKIYSKCIVCRMNNDGEFESLQNEDFEKIVNYLSE